MRETGGKCASENELPSERDKVIIVRKRGEGDTLPCTQCVLVSRKKTDSYFKMTVSSNQMQLLANPQ